MSKLFIFFLDSYCSWEFILFVSRVSSCGVWGLLMLVIVLMCGIVDSDVSFLVLLSVCMCSMLGGIEVVYVVVVVCSVVV